MIDTNALRAAWVRKGMRQKDVAEALKISDRTMTSKMSKRVFDSDEIEKMIELLEIVNPVEVFFAK